MVEKDINSSLQKTRDPVEFDYFNERINVSAFQKDRSDFLKGAINNFKRVNSNKINDFKFEQEQIVNEEKLTKEYSEQSNLNSRRTSRANINSELNVSNSHSKITLVKRLKSSTSRNNDELDGEISPRNSPIKSLLKIPKSKNVNINMNTINQNNNQIQHQSQKFNLN